MIHFSDFEVYLKSKIAEIHPIPNDDKSSTCSDPIGMPINLPINYRLAKFSNPLDASSTKKSLTNDSRVSVYFTPQDSVDQPQVQISPMHINYIQENLDSYIGCLKPASSNPKFDFDMHRLQTNLEKEIDRRRSRYRVNSEDYESAGDEMLEIDAEQTKMLNNVDVTEDGKMAGDLGNGYIRLNTLPKRSKFKKFAGNKDLYYSLENVFDSNAADNFNYYQMQTSTKTIDETSETQLTSSASDNCSSNEASNSNQLNSCERPLGQTYSIKHPNPSQSVLELNRGLNGDFKDLQISNSLPNVSESDDVTTTLLMNTKKSNHNQSNELKSENNQTSTAISNGVKSVE